MKYSSNPDTDHFIRLLSKIRKHQNVIDVNISCNIVFRKEIDGTVGIGDMTILNPKGRLIQVYPPYPKVGFGTCNFEEFKRFILSQFEDGE